MKLFKHFTRILSLILVLALLVPLAVSAAEVTTFESLNVTGDDIVVLFTNDVHGGTSDREPLTGTSMSLGYAGLAAVKAEAEALAAGVTLVDMGDSIQGSVVTEQSKGEDIMALMEAAGFDICVLGNHDFDYGVEGMLTRVDAHKALNFMSCNFTDMDGNLVLPKGYQVNEYDVNGETVKVAFVAITTPEAISKGSAETFQDENGNWLYTFNADTPEALYAFIQKNIDAAIAEGAEYVVAVGHMGDQGVEEGWSSKDVIANTTGLCAFLDGHAHSVVEQEKVTALDGAEVLLSSTGTKLENIGVLKLNFSGDAMVASTALVNTLTEEEKASQAYTDMNKVVKEAEGKYEYLVEVVGETAFNLYINDPETNERMVRKQDSNMANLLTDAYMWYTGYDSKFEPADVVLLNGGGIRASISAGDITYTHVMNVFPFGNLLGEFYATGQQIMDCLEMGARLNPEECGGFMNVSGLTYEVDLTKESKVVTNADGLFEKVDGTVENGDYRVQNVVIGGEPLDLAKVYTVVTHTYHYLDGGDGMTMFKECEQVVGPEDNVVDLTVALAYLKEELGGVVPEKYENPYGEGRVTILSADAEAPAETEAPTEAVEVTEAPAETEAPAAEEPAKSSPAPVILAVVVIAVIIGGFVYWLKKEEK